MVKNILSEASGPCSLRTLQSKASSQRIAFLTSYDGTDFVGFQWQNNGRSVQAVLEKALLSLYKENIRVSGCSRTDAGVHASAHVSHADVPFFIPEDKIALAMNSHLPDDIAVLDAIFTDDDFHARFDACGKRYVYRIWNHPIRPVLQKRFQAHIPAKLDVSEMKKAAESFVGEHDFSAFCAAGGQQVSPIRYIEDVQVEKSGPEIRIVVRGKSFLYNMVRIMAGTLVYVGMGKFDAKAIGDALSWKDRRFAGKTMPAHGLTLEQVFYEKISFPLQERKEKA